MQTLTMKDYYLGEEAMAIRGTLAMEYPVERGIINNWEDMENIWRHVFVNELKINPKEHPILITEPPLNPHRNQETTTQIMFEKFETPAFYMSLQGI